MGRRRGVEVVSLSRAAAVAESSTRRTMSAEETEWSVDRAFVESVLRRSEGDPLLHVTDVDVEDAVGKGENYASVLVRVRVSYTTPTSPDVATRSLIVKTPPRGELMRSFVRRTRFFETEAHMYAETIPAMRALLADSMAPAMLHTDRADTIVLEDLRDKGFKMADRRRGLDWPHSQEAVRALARLHAASLALFDADPCSMDAYPETFYCESNRRMLVNHLTEAMTNLANHVESWTGFERFAPKLHALAPHAVDRAIAVVCSSDTELRVLNHGDFWTNNMLFDYDDAGCVRSIQMLDFQMARFASPALDLLYFLYTSPQQAVLEERRDDLVVEYHTTLTDAMRRLGVGVEISLERLQAELQAKLYYALMTSVLYSIMVADEDEVPDLSVLTEADQNSPTSVSPLNKTRSGKIFRHAFERRLPWFESQGLFD